MKAVIFLGPSLPLSEARKILNAIYLPPVGQADVVSAVTTYNPDVIGIIDGEFLQSLSVWHKEILYAIDQGVLVYGASSMGALRAVETADFGMIGIGEIYRMYADGELNDDDEVALAYNVEETGYQKLSEPMVNIRATLRLAIEEGIINKALHQQLISIAKRIYFPERTFAHIFGKAAAEGVSKDVLERMKQFVSEQYQDIKRQDAALLLQTIRDLPNPLPKAIQDFTFTCSYSFQTLYNRDRTVRHENVSVPLDAMANYVALHHLDFADLNFNALNRALVVILAELLEVKVEEEEVDQESQRFRTRHDLKTEEEFVAWLTRNDLRCDEFKVLMQEIALCRTLQRWLLTARFMDRSTKFVLDQLRLQNRYEEWAEQAGMQEQILQVHHPLFKQTSIHGMKMKQLVSEHLQQTHCHMDTHFSIWAEEAGFHTVEDLRLELIRSKLVREFFEKLATQLSYIMVDDQDVKPGDDSSKEDA